MSVISKCVGLMAGIFLFAMGVSQAFAVSGKEQMETFLDGLVTLKADFEQRVWSGSQGQRSVGILYLQRPGRFRWDYRTPDQSVIADGRRIWLHDRELEQVSYQGQERALEGTPALLLVDTGPLENHFRIQEMGPHQDRHWVELLPIQEESEFTRILLGFRSNELQELEMTDKFGQVTRFNFEHVERNAEIDPALFVFRPPPGMDVFGD